MATVPPTGVTDSQMKSSLRRFWRSISVPLVAVLLGALIGAIIGLGGRMDWGVHSYNANGSNGIDPRNGGIVGTVSYDTTRNELDPRYAAVEDWQPGVPDLTVDLYTPVDCEDELTQACDPGGYYRLDSDGSYMKGQLLNSTPTETWQRPGTNDDGICSPRDADGNRLGYPDGQRITGWVALRGAERPPNPR